MKLKKITLGFVLAAVALPVMSQTTREEMFADIRKTAGVYYAYPAPEKLEYTAPPKGYKPFYISHFGRHGSRYLIGENEYTDPIDKLAAADSKGKLSKKGKDALARLREIYKEAEGRSQDLSPLGVRQHRGVAERMYGAFPEVFSDGKTVSARSSMIMRCAMSMVAFGDRLKELSPALKISYESSQKYMPYLTGRSEESNEYTGSKGPWRVEYNKFRKAHTNSARFAAALFNDQEYVAKYVDTDELMWEFYWVASDLQNMETEISLYDLFTKDELFDLWQCFNMQFYYGNANSLPSGGKVMNSYKPLLRDIIGRADSAIANPEMAATLRFAHDSNIVPLTALMRINDCAVAIDEPDSLYRYWTDFKVSPMCANLQIVFFNKKGGTSDDVLVKFILNEHEAKIPVETDNYPYYRWPDVKAYYEKILEE